MKKDNILYNKQFISVDICIFSLQSDKLSVLLTKRAKEPFANTWSLFGGGVFNNETCEDAIIREVKEKLNIENINPILTGVFSDPKRDKRFRNISVSYYVLLKDNRINITPTKNQPMEVKWFNISEVPELAFDHKNILSKSLDLLKERIFDIPFISQYIKQPFTLSNLQSLYESILNTKLDKRNFRRKLLNLKCLIDTGKKNLKDSHKKSSLFKFAH